jgi:hypothetical protein
VSTLKVANIEGIGSPKNLTIPQGHFFAPVGHIVQVQYVRTDLFPLYTALTTGDGIPIVELSISITPRLQSSMLLVKWMINYEAGADTGFLIHRNSELITDVNFTGYNTQSISRWSSYSTAFYDNDNSSTMSNSFIHYFIPSKTTNLQTFTPAIRSTSGSNQTFYLNRTIGNAGTNGHENTVSAGMIMEIAA